MCAGEKRCHLVCPADSVRWFNSHANTFFFALTCLTDGDHPLPPPFLFLTSVFLYRSCIFIHSHILVAVPPLLFLYLFLSCKLELLYILGSVFVSYLSPSLSSVCLCFEHRLCCCSILVIIWLSCKCMWLSSILSAFVHVCVYICPSLYMCVH